MCRHPMLELGPGTLFNYISLEIHNLENPIFKDGYATESIIFLETTLNKTPKGR